METEGIITGKIGDEVTITSKKLKFQDKDEMAPWSKISNKFKRLIP